ncbi:hormogonium polysaccharide biosynthesis protein HpsL [Spirulina major CS-329]|jgi:hypothetical protein|uniref:hormogonium polysaccharide biosynthesis protein HpsL n=1 Tax=Spirulina TaxID=1154 RepID=UPI002330090F|nr:MULTISPECIES: hormogonium polysaccharide biosynthesis protein HpsL [Spirulina]MDB9497012.1 hormogonium polysaccharide biosynthesis protein HpsL [Spirulina subsalsa CS-330]MDB9505360.1 hormogonium polysaccharide biosynthesis protein HpsL [Spirulina major CS-329]
MVKTKRRKTNKKNAAPTAPPLTPKELAAQKRQAKEHRQKLIQVNGVCIAFLLVVGLPLILINEKIGLALGAGVPVMYWSYQYPRSALWLFLVYMPFSGTVIYQLVGGNALFNLAKDAFFIPALIALVLKCKQEKKPIFVKSEIMATLGILTLCACLTLIAVNGSMQFILPMCSSLPRRGRGMLCKEGIPLAQGVLGLKVLMGYIPLIFCAYYFVRDKKGLLWLCRVHLILALICCGLGVLQYLMLESGSCEGTRNEVGDALFKASVEAKCLVGGSLGYSPSQNFIRLPGTFASPWHWSWFLISNSALTFTTTFCDTSLWWRLGGLAGMGLVFVNAVISGQRIALALVPVVTVILLVLTGQLANVKRFLPIGIGLAVVLSVAIASNPELIQERIESFQSRAEASPPQAFIMEQFRWATEEQRGFLGRGLGKATNSTRIFGETALVETFHPKLLYEMGYPGLFAFILFTGNITWVTHRITRSLKTPSVRNFASSFWVFILIISFFPYWYPLDTDPVAVYYWFFIGVMFNLPNIDAQEQEKLKAEAREAEELLRQNKAARARLRNNSS